MQKQSIEYQKIDSDIQFLIELRKRVNSYFKMNALNKYGNTIAIVKAIAFVALNLIASISIFYTNTFGQLLLAYSVIGVSAIFIALNLSHDAAHNSFVKSKKINNILVYTFDMLGASGYIWKHKHIYSHHPHVNIPTMDNDIKESKLIRIFPNAPWLSNHRFQHLYMPPLYLFYTLFWMIFRDFKDFFETDKQGRPLYSHERKEYIILFSVKFIFVLRMLILPYLILPFSFGQVLLGFLCFHFVASFTVALPLVSAHVGEHAQFPQPDEDGLMPSSWVRHQLITTTDFATESPLINHLFGGFNHHVVHHLFPDICNIHYPQLTKILKQACYEFHMPYSDNPSMTKAVWSHLKFLKKQGREGMRAEYIDM